MTKYDLIIIGGGWAGLSAATYANNKGMRVALIERNRELGGRAASFYDESFSEWLDNGPHIFIGAYRSSLDLLNRWDSADAVDFSGGIDIPWLYPRGKTVWLRLGQDSSKFGKAAGLLKFEGMTIMERMKTVKAAEALSRYRPMSGSREPTVRMYLKRYGLKPNDCGGFWEALTTAVLNGPADRVGINSLARAVQDGLLIGGEAARLGVPVKPFREFFAVPSESYLTQAGVDIHKGINVKSLCVSSIGAVTGVDAGRRVYKADAVIAAVTPVDLMKLAPGEDRSPEFFHRFEQFEYSSIAAVHVDYDRAVMPHRFGFLPGAFSHWVFGRGERESTGWRKVSAVISSVSGRRDLAIDQIEALVLNDLSERLPGARPDGVVGIRTIRTVRATVLLTPGTDEIRPPVRTPIKNLYLAGDWIDTGLPATIESAARAGAAAVDEVGSGL